MRLFQKVERAQPRGFHRHLNVRLARHHHHRRGYARGLDLLQQRQPVHRGHHHVRKDHVELFRLDHLQRFDRIVTDGGFMSRQPEGTRKRRQRVGVIIDDKEVSFHRSAISN